ncbi:hypothetical protein HNQ40_003306 [Algisphaera agarilytica]|uniref:Uncharacterized protein n=1 Tax=Algisphaera agarilytica TaxID=1385975 RepID=A0A7X0HBU5_9BACT|nr:hypothetical protein [Algisphaera agarilytica]
MPDLQGLGLMFVGQTQGVVVMRGGRQVEDLTYRPRCNAKLAGRNGVPKFAQISQRRESSRLGTMFQQFRHKTRKNAEFFARKGFADGPSR